MVETEMSMNIKTNLIISNTCNKPSDNYSKVETKEKDYYIDPKDIQLGIYSKNKNESDNSNDPINSDQLLPISIEKSQYFFYKKLGNTFAFFGDIYGNPKIIIGPHWYLFIYVTFSFTLAFFIEIILFFKYTSKFMKILGNILYFIFLFSYSYTALINPGFPKYDIDSVTGEPRKKFYYCSSCKIWVSREKKTLHCSDCNICIEGLDHHCPWTGKCIGNKNLISYYIFVPSSFILIIYYICLISLLNKDSLFNKNN